MRMPSPEQLKAWADSYLKGTISESDKKALEAWYTSLHETEINWNEPGIDSANALQSRIFDAINQKIEQGDKQPRRTYWLPVSSAAAVLGLIALTLFYMQRRPAQGKNPTSGAEIQQAKDIQPGATKATLLLADGKEIPINSQHLLNVTTRKGAVCVLDKDGKLSYLGSAPSSNIYNTLVTHKGEQSPPLILPDGTKVWLNAASTLRFPVAFTGKERLVSLSGEAYFEVARNTQHPFIVSTSGNKVEVLGTHFDIMAYDDEPFTYATLLEGAIRVSNEHHSFRLSPGQQSKTSVNGDIHVGMVDTEQSIAWMNGQLPLNNMDVKRFLREVARWYDVAVVYDGEPPVLSFSGSLNKDVPISQIIAALNANGIHCKLKDKTVIVAGR